ncbi:hypothetical protein ACEWY4_019040 [Coilia grayii]|uniref:Chemokine interleukin-8-like domain-containing protein n=1 Tax=Coilia grayii TaxID=363190 RepID=A0ABD1JGH7_9TELE
MQSVRTPFRSLAIMAIIAAAMWAKADAEKFTSCCTAVFDEEVTDPIIGFRLQRRNNQCVNAVILTTDKNKDFCCPVKSLWVGRKIQEFLNNLGRRRPSTASTP